MPAKTSLPCTNAAEGTRTYRFQEDGLKITLRKPCDRSTCCRCKLTCDTNFVNCLPRQYSLSLALKNKITYICFRSVDPRLLDALFNIMLLQPTVHLMPNNHISSQPRSNVLIYSDPHMLRQSGFMRKVRCSASSSSNSCNHSCCSSSNWSL